MREKKLVAGTLIVVAALSVFSAFMTFAQDAAAPVEVAPGIVTTKSTAEETKVPTFMEVVLSSGALGVIIWLGLLATSIAAVALIVDSGITIRGKKIMSPSLVANVKAAMEEGDVMKAMKHCEAEPGAMANILLAGFSNVEEGFDVIQDAVGTAADLENEKLVQRVTYLSVDSNLAPMLGLLGTVQGMIYAFATLATTQAGAAQQAKLAINIAQALYTTAAGLLIAIPAVACYYYFRNRLTRIILNMELTTMDLIKSLRNVEVVEQ